MAMYQVHSEFGEFEGKEGRDKRDMAWTLGARENKGML